eukprot:gb/GECH01007004.1/.p1 GENE.gb/GECH01007004.1/~~gb/GECH01007004.1/.p1  ORF type:complete len:111 (+),score=19.40 gb/GECH01007004.1/:1-333(+)
MSVFDPSSYIKSDLRDRSAAIVNDYSNTFHKLVKGSQIDVHLHKAAKATASKESICKRTGECVSQAERDVQELDKHINFIEKEAKELTGLSKNIDQTTQRLNNFFKGVKL